MLDTQSCQYSWQWEGWHCSKISSFFAHLSALSLPITNMKLPACELMPCVSKFCLNKWQDIWDCCEGNKLHSIYLTVGIVKHSKKCFPLRFRPAQQTANWSFSTHSLILIEWWWLPNLSILRNSTHRKTHISGMRQLAGHSWKYFTVSSLAAVSYTHLTLPTNREV